ncbi:uncharacterized protein METZ01_LOCUS336513 [marine metagenome]|uniref:Uncharacterized protein n=1 Tax=marine metagenome TaxID=408172 RepID=A0A382QDM2_9ZZZZ
MLLKDIYAGLSKRGKAVFWLVVALAAIGALQLFSGCSVFELGKTWRF